MRSTSFFVAIVLLLVQTSWTQVAGHGGSFHDDAWQEFLQLSGYGIGQSHAVLPSLKRYLHHFGYLDTITETGFTSVFDEDLQSAIKKYQLFFSLNATGVLDPATVHQLIQPRCGIRDIIKGAAPAKFHLINVTGNSTSALYEVGESRWPSSSRHLYYYIEENEHLPFPIEDIRLVIGEAFETWAAESPFVFTETWIRRVANLQVGFFVGEHLNCPWPFYEGDGVLAHAFDPPDGRIHFDADNIWAIDPEELEETEGSNDLLSIAIHEIGHMLGLGHSSVTDAVMFPVIPPQSRQIELHPDDLAGITALYPLG